MKLQSLASQIARGDTQGSFVEVLCRHAQDRPSGTALLFLREGEEEVANITFSGLDGRARAIAAFLQKEGIQEQRVLLLLPSGVEFITAFLGCLYAGVIAVPAFPFHPGRSRRGESWFRSVAADAHPLLAFATPEMIAKLPKNRDDAGYSTMRWISPEDIDLSLAEEWNKPLITSETIALLQYTSGSTSLPKGVMVSHGNLLHNMRVIQAACETNEHSTVVTWLPLYHDMGLIGTVLQPVYLGARCVLMSPAAFLQKPVRWLRAISRYKAHSSSGPNFAYDLCARKISPAEKAGLELSAWRVAVNGAEPVRYETMERFASAFAECGFRMESFYPAYGLAESTLMVTGSRPVVPKTIRVSAEALERHIVQETSGAELTRVLVGCGSVHAEQQLRIVDPNTLQECENGKVGEIWLSGPSVAHGYWNRPEETAAVFYGQLPHGGGTRFFRTGDLGFLAAGQLFITGRLKDLIILHGRNIYPQDIELTVQRCHPSLRSGCGAAFTVEVDDQEALVIVNEVERHPDTEPEKLISAICEAVLLEHGIQAYSVLLLKPGAVPKTTSGKIKRGDCRAAYLNDRMQPVAGVTFPRSEWRPEFAGERLTRAELLQTEPELRQEMVEAYLREEVTLIAKVKSAEIRSEQSLVGLGIDSVGATELANRIELELGLRVEISSLLEDTTLSQFASMIVEQIGCSEEKRPIPAQLHENEPWPLSEGQKGLWILYQIAPGSAAYTLASAVRIKGRLDSIALENALLQVMARHHMLRAVFRTKDGEPIQAIQPIAAISRAHHVRRIDLSEPEAARLQERLAEHVQAAFVLDKASPVRLLIFGLPSGDDILMLVLHHLIADLSSIAIIHEELSAAYLAHYTGHPANLPEIRSNYLDFIRWQSERIHGPEGESLLNYWRAEIGGDLPALQLPADRARPSVFSYRGASEPLRLPANLYSRVQSIARAENVTAFMLLAGAFQILLHRISGQKDVLLGSPANGRSRAEFAQVVGYFANPVVLRSRYNSSLSFTSYLHQVRHTALQAFRHQDYPFPLLVDQLHPKREAGLSPIFQTMFVWQELPGRQGEALAALSIGNADALLEFGGALVKPVRLENTGSQFDLTLLMTASGADLLGLLKYSTDLFDQTTIHRLANQFSALLHSIIENPRQQLSALRLMTQKECSQILQCGLGQPVAVPKWACIHELFEDQVQRHHAATAVIMGEKQIDFRELNIRANQFARYLRALGVKAESLVGVCLERSLETIAAILGIWKAGGTYVPLDRQDPRARLTAIIEQTSMQALIVHEHLLDRLPEQLPPVVLLDLDLDAIAQEAGSNLNIGVDENSLAYVIHTSGSTGIPKGVMIEHHSLNNLLIGLSKSVYSAEKDRLVVGLNAPFTFDSSIKQLITLAMGHTLCLIPEDIRRNGPALLAYAQDKGIDVLDCTPTQVQVLFEAGWDDSAGSVMFLLGGEPVPEQIWKTLAARKLTPCYNLYGPTECTVDATACRIDVGQGPSIGRPLCGTNVYILDTELELVPVGVPGEIFIGGNSTGRGYWGRPDLTAERFLPDPYNSMAGARMYRSGDQACWLPDSNIRFIGRVDRQVKVRGFRIEPGEIEAALRVQPGVKEAVVVARNTGDGTRRLVGYVVSAEERTSSYYRQALARILPDYMVPATVVSLASIPVNVHGKKDYASLPIPDVTELDRNDYIPPHSPLEQYLVNLWTAELRVQPIGINDNFFSLGGDSLQATKLITRIQEKYPSNMPLLALFFENPTIASLARFISAPTNVPVQSEAV